VDQVSQFFIDRIDPTGFTTPDDYDCPSQFSQLGRFLSIARYFLSVYGPNKSALLPKPRAVDVSSSRQFEEEIGDASSENGLFIAKMEFSVRTPSHASEVK